MRTLIALILLLVGLGIVLYGLGSALMQLVGLYQGALNDALAEPKVSEQAASAQMLRSALIGAIGIPPLMAGSAMLSIGMWKRVLRRFAERR